ncbi:molybdopterin-dependent oxidoreductase [Zooshikella sp. RANM57]|uniref:molybdopterin-dependent oxidoreductase n=1 Tax=Zooshikella sp. RANM57 TaxID=3425863 RepID=UPI003D6F4344
MDNHWIKTTCAFCGVGCGVEARVKNNKVIVRGDKQHPANFGRLCSKGMALGETVTDQGRLLHPQIEGQVTHWDTALTTVADTFQQIINKYGPEAIGFYLSGQLLTEDYYVANKLMKGFIGSANIDTNSRLCMSSSVAGHKRAYGSDTVPGCYEDLEKAELIIITGSNLAWCHPVLYQRISSAKQQNNTLKVVLIDPRCTVTTQLADLHLAIQPGTDVLLFNGLLHYLDKVHKLNSEFISAHTEGFNSALHAAKAETTCHESLASTLGVPTDILTQFYHWFAETDNIVTLYSQGINQSSCGTDKVNSIINCHLATRKIGKPGCGPFSLTGQPNAMGGREVGGMANTLAAHLEFENPQHHELLSQFWQTQRLVKQPGLKAVALFDAIASGKIKAIWIMATNPAVSLPHTELVKSALKACPFVVVSDCMMETDTNQYANILLPAASWGEKSGTVTNSERRISRQRSLKKASGDAKPDWWIITEVAKKMGFNHAFNYTKEADIFKEYAQLTAFKNNGSRDLNLAALTNLNDDEYNSLAPVQWPTTLSNQLTPHPSTKNKRFFDDGQFYTPSKKAQFIAVQFKAPASTVDTNFPFILNTGRIRDQWHTMTRTALAPRLSTHIPEPFINIHPVDAYTQHIINLALARISSTQGTVIARACITEEVKPGQIFMPIHWTHVLSSNGQIGKLINAHVDPLSGQPELKFTPITISPWNYQSEAIIISQQNIQLEKKFEYWVKQHIKNGYLYRIASQQPVTKTLALLLAQLNSLKSCSRLEYYNNTRQLHRYSFIRNQQLQACFFIAPKLNQSDFTWLNEILTTNFHVHIQQSLLSGNAIDELTQGKIICACKQIGHKTICNAINKHHLETVKAVASATQAGSVCGSCIPEIEILLAANAHRQST